ncbi:MAG: hypothetical protein Q8Q54_14335 [Methylococcales bacterium]|nr:hypothetical protein [Methylococcales bacterium]
MNGWKFTRITILLAIFVTLAFYSKIQKLQARSWAVPLQVVIYPINGDNNSASVNEYINALDGSVFQPVDDFIKQQSLLYQSSSHPTQTQLGAVMTLQPPASPKPDANVFAIVAWSMKLRYWAYKNTPDVNSNLHRIRVFVYYHEPVAGRHLEHSLGLDKGLIAIVHAFAAENYDEQNNVVIVHELLHTVGATDKYDANGQPFFPDGYAAANQSPLYPQSKAEIMAIGIPENATKSHMAGHLNACVIGEQTAKEINWLTVR